ncbi:MAG: sel1 repeat family protein [Telluria sp.]
MRKFLVCLALLLGANAMADELADANKLLESKSYPQAIAMLTRLADAGNTNAQLRLGQVYWYGEGVAVDRAKGDALFAKAAAAGNAEAKVAMGLTPARQQHMADIEYWTTRYDGADLTSGQFECKAPAVPDKSTTRDDVKATGNAVNQWKACYNGFAKHLAEAMPAGKVIPVEVSDLMTDKEMDQARAHLDQVYSRIASTRKASADQTLAAYDKWEKNTTDYLRQQKVESDRLMRENEISMQNAARTATPAPPPPTITPPVRR